MRLSDMKDGQKGVVISYDDPLVAGRMMTMGVLPGKAIKLVRKSLMGECLYIQSEGLVMAIRRREGDKIQMSM